MFPFENYQATANQLPVKINYTSSNNISKVNYYIDRSLIMTKTSEPFNEDILNISGISAGQHLLEIQIFDQYLNNRKQGVLFSK